MIKSKSSIYYNIKTYTKFQENDIFIKKKTKIFGLDLKEKDYKLILNKKILDNKLLVFLFLRKKIQLLKLDYLKKKNFIDIIFFLNKRFNVKIKGRFLLKTIFGFNIKYLIQLFLNLLGYGLNCFVWLININQLFKLQSFIKNALFNYKLTIYIKKNIERKKLASIYQGFKYFKRLPCRGQNSKTNAQTAKKRQFFKF